MKKLSNYSFVIAFIWFGFVTAISFMEAPVKFTAPSLTLAVGLDVGRHVFSALNKIEWVFLLITAAAIILNRSNRNVYIVASLILIILLLQTFWLLPALEKRILIYIEGSVPPESFLHFYYVGFEIIKVILIFIIGMLQLDRFKQQFIKGDLS